MADYHLFPPRRANEAFVRDMTKPLTASESIVGNSVMFGPLVVGLGLPIAIALGLHRQPSLWMVGALVLTPLALYVLVFGLITRSSDPRAPVRALEAIPVGSLGKLPDGTLGALAGRIVPTHQGTIEGPLTKGPFVWIDVTACVYRDGNSAQRESRTRSVPFYVEAADGERALVVPDQDALLRSATHSREERSNGPRRTEVLRACDEMGLRVDDERVAVWERAFRAGDQVFGIVLLVLAVGAMIGQALSS